jgi:hypothetical protein
MTLRGQVKNGVVVFQSGYALPDGILVEVTPVPADPFAEGTFSRGSKERQEASRQLIGICKTEHPPNDEEVERILEEERMKKYG